LLLANEDTGESPVLLGPILIHQSKSFSSYFELASSLYQNGIKKIQAFGTDGDPNIYKSFLSVFPDSMHLLCELHVKDNVVKKMNECNIDKKTQQQILNKLFGFQVGTESIDGLVQAKSDEEFDERFDEFVGLLHTSNNTSEFHNYFMKFKVDLFEKKLRADYRSKAGLGDPPKPYYQNSNESMNSLLKYQIDKEKQLYEFIKHYKAVLKQEQEKIEISLTGAGKFKIRDEFSKCFSYLTKQSSALNHSLSNLSNNLININYKKLSTVAITLFC
jgi:hypothetical protein